MTQLTLTLDSLDTLVSDYMGMSRRQILEVVRMHPAFDVCTDEDLDSLSFINLVQAILGRRDFSIKEIDEAIRNWYKKERR